jgi:nitroreductase
MMIEILRERRSIRKYQETKIEPEKVELLKEAVLRAPSGKNSQPCEFIFVDDREVIGKLAASKPGGAQFLEGAPLAIVVLGDEDKSDTWVLLDPDKQTSPFRRSDSRGICSGTSWYPQKLQSSFHNCRGLSWRVKTGSPRKRSELYEDKGKQVLKKVSGR